MSREGRFSCGGVTPLIRVARAGSSTTLCCGPLGSARIAVSISSQPRLDIPHFQGGAMGGIREVAKEACGLDIHRSEVVAPA